MPRWFPSPKFANQASGAAEIVLGLGMIPRRTRPLAARGLLVLTAVVYPANIDMAINDVVVKPGDNGRMERVEGSSSTVRESSSLAAAVRDGVGHRRHLRLR